MTEIRQRIEFLAEEYSRKLDEKITIRKEEMNHDDNSHYMLYNVLGISDEDGYQIDLYQNVGRFLYRHAGSFLEDAAIACFQYKFPQAQANVKIPNTIDSKPRNVEIDCLVGNNAFEIKWRDATTDGDHIAKEEKRVTGYTPIRIMFYYPNREQSRRIQNRLEGLYISMGGQYFAGQNAWNLIKEFTGVDLKEILKNIAKTR